ncbi:MAG: hypothetical protein J6M65_06235 [Eubacterium sp.]|nr:hypothetical protein [Eubacterium sp.]
MKRYLYQLKRYIAAILIGTMIVSLVSCGKEEEAPYSSPNFSEKKEDSRKSEVLTEPDSSITDAIEKAQKTDKASPGDASATDAAVEEVPHSVTDASAMGMYDKNTYYNTLAGFMITVDNEEWKFYDAAGVASVTGTQVDDIINLWHGYRSPHDSDTTYGAIAYNTKDGSNIIVSYINPEAYLMPDFNSTDYLTMSSSRYESFTISKVTFLDESYMCMDVKDEAEVGKRTLFAIDRDGLIVLITFTLQDETQLEDAVKLFKPLDY